MSDGPIVRRISFDIHGEFITQLAREWFYTGEKSHEKVIEILMDSMTGTDTPEAQIRRYAEDVLLGRAALKGSTEAGTYHLETYEPGEEEQMPQSMNIWKEVERRKKQLDELDDFAMQLNRAKKHETVRMWIFGCRSCGSITMVNRQPFDDWHECPVCRQMVHLNSLPSKEFEIVDTGETWQEQIKRAAEEGNSWQ